MKGQKTLAWQSICLLHPQERKCLMKSYGIIDSSGFVITQYTTKNRTKQVLKKLEISSMITHLYLTVTSALILALKLTF